LIGTYIDHVATTPYDKKGNLPRANTLAHHAKAAFAFLRQVIPEPFSIFLHGDGKTLVPYICSRIELRRKWEQPREKREPYTYAMFKAFSKLIIKEAASDKRSFLNKHALIFDTQQLGIFTGSRVSEYAQTKGSRSCVSRVPQQPGLPPDSTLPVAFVASDFVFLADNGRILPHKELFSDPKQAKSLHITFRHDKSGRNYCVRKYGRGTDFLCPIAAAISLLYRAHLLQISPRDPICAYRIPNGRRQYLRDTEVTETMRKICVAAYPDPCHYLRINIKRFASHSNRVTAAVALSQNKMTIDEIAHRLRWKPESVSYYLRESSQDIGTYTANAIHGAQRDF
jgi:hypothetical protein